MYRALGLGQPRKDRQRPLARAFREPSCGEDLTNLAQMAMSVRIWLLDPHNAAHATQAMVGHTLGFQRVATQRQRRQTSAQILQIQPGMQQRAEQHVAADSGEAVEIRQHPVRLR